MQNPVEVERRYNELQVRLSHLSSLRHRWAVITDFLSSIGHDLRRFDTYVLQLVPSFPVLEHPLSFAGTRPSASVATIRLLHRCEQEIPELKDRSHYKDAKAALIKATCLLLAFTGSIQELVKLYESEQNIEADRHWLLDVDRSAELSNLQKVNALSNAARAKGLYQLGQWLDEIGQEWRDILSNTQPHSVLIPVVESAREDRESLGRLRRLSARVTGEIDEQRDTIQNNFAVVGAEKAASKETETVATVVRSRLNETHPGLTNRFFDVLLSYSMHKGWQLGSSSEAGAASTSYCAILDYAEQRATYTLDANIVITGKLDEEGNVQPIDEQGIKAKAEAAFFSWVSMMAVPADQEQAFAREIANLRDSYPHRDPLRVVGVRHLRELFFDRRVTHYTVLSRPRYYLKRAWANKFSVAGSAIILVLLLMLARLLYGPIDKNPVNGVFKGEHLFVKISMDKH